MLFSCACLGIKGSKQTLNQESSNDERKSKTRRFNLFNAISARQRGTSSKDLVNSSPGSVEANQQQQRPENDPANSLAITATNSASTLLDHDSRSTNAVRSAFFHVSGDWTETTIAECFKVDRLLVRANLENFTEEKAEILKAIVMAKSEARTDEFTLVIENGRPQDCDRLNAFIQNELVSCKCKLLLFRNCVFSVETIRALFGFISRPQRDQILDVEKECKLNVTEEEMTALTEEFLQIIIQNRIVECAYSYDISIRNGTIVPSYTLTLTFPNRGSTQTLFSWGQRPVHEKVVPKPDTHFGTVIQLLETVETLEKLDLSSNRLFTEDLLLLCDSIRGLNRKVHVGIGTWDIYDPNANQAIFDFISSTPNVNSLTLKSVGRIRPALPVQLITEALSASTYLESIRLCLENDGSKLVVEFFEYLDQYLGYPNRLREITSSVTSLVGSKNQVLNNRLTLVLERLQKRLQVMQSKKSKIMIPLVYGVARMKINSKVSFQELSQSCPFTLLTIDILKRLWVFLDDQNDIEVARAD